MNNCLLLKYRLLISNFSIADSTKSIASALVERLRIAFKSPYKIVTQYNQASSRAIFMQITVLSLSECDLIIRWVMITPDALQ